MPPNNEIFELKARIASLTIANDAWRAVAQLNAMTIDRLFAANQHYRQLIADLQADRNASTED